MKEIGGYLELDNYTGNMLHDNALKLNSCRNALAYLIINYKIKSILLPSFLCDSVIDTCNAYKVKIIFYSVDKNFKPIDIKYKKNDYLYLVNYYGQLSDSYKKEIVKKYKNVIIDNTHDYYAKPIRNAIGNLYSCRKFFGVSDGGILYTKKTSGYDKLENDKSYERLKHILGRYENEASSFYCDYVANEELLDNLKPMKMSRLTENLLKAIDYKEVLKKRNNNFNFLYDKLKMVNEIKVKKVKGAYAYPLYLNNAEKIRKKLISNKVYVPILWPNVIKDSDDNSLEYKLANNILPLPCDQRYSLNDMKTICDIIIGELEGVK